MASWGLAQINQVALVYNGNSISEADKQRLYAGVAEGLPYIGTKDVGFDHTIEYASGVRIPEARQGGFKRAPANTVLVCAEGGSAGRKIAHTDRDVCFGNKLFAVCPIADVNSRFVFYFCCTEDFRAQFRSAMAGLIGGVSLNKFKALRIALPPLDEQRRIVAILDEAFEYIATAKANAEKNLQNARAVFESYLQDAYSVRVGHLPRERLEGLCEKNRLITYGVIKLGDPVEGGVPCLRTSNVRWLEIDTTGMKKIARALAAEYSRTILRGGEVLVNVRGTLGGVAVVPNHMAGWNVSREVAVVPVNAAMLDPEYAAFWIGSRTSQDWLSGVKKGAAYTGINIEDLRNLPVPLPVLETQRAIVDDVLAIRDATRRMEEIYERKLAALDELKKSLLHQAFTGALTAKSTDKQLEAVA